MSFAEEQSSHPGHSDVSVPELDGPDEYHVYIGCCDTDAPVHFKIKTIWNEFGFTFYEDDPELARSENIESGITKCRNVLFLVSPSYMKNEWYALEIQQAINTAEIRGNRSLMVVRCGVPESEISAQLRGFKTVEYSEDVSLKEKLHIYLSEPLPPLAQLKKDNFGAALAYSYFSGFLKFVLPELAPTIRNSGMQQNSDGDRIMSHKMFIIIPESCRAPTDLCDLDENLKSYSSIKFQASRAGVKGRQYNIPVYEFTDVETDEVYRIVVEIATPVVTLLEMRKDKACTETERTTEVHRFYFHVKSLLTQSKYKHLRLQHRACIVYYKDMPSDCEKFGTILMRRLKQEIENEKQGDELGLVDEQVKEAQEPDDGLVTVKVGSEDNEHVILNQELLTCYPLSNRPRGNALIINNIYFDTLKHRRGAERDQAKMKKLLTDLHFHVDEFENLTAARMKDVMAHYSSRKYSDDLQAFVCCIMSHGKLGQLYGTDGKYIEITKITEKFTSCESLRCRPKIFFIQACQAGQSDTSSRGDSDQADGQTALHSDMATAEVAATQPDAVELKSCRSDLVPGAPDFVMSYATLPGSLSYRHRDVGALYINALDFMMRQWSKQMPLDRILMKVTEDVNTKYVAPTWDQYPFHLHTTDKLIYLKFN